MIETDSMRYIIANTRQVPAYVRRATASHPASLHPNTNARSLPPDIRSQRLVAKATAVRSRRLVIRPPIYVCRRDGGPATPAGDGHYLMGGRLGTCSGEQRAAPEMHLTYNVHDTSCVLRDI